MKDYTLIIEAGKVEQQYFRKMEKEFADVI